MKFDPHTMKPQTFHELRIVANTDLEAEPLVDFEAMFPEDNHLTVNDVMRVQAEFGRLNHDMVKRGMGPNWPADWNERTAIFDPPGCYDCGTTGQCHMNCGPALSPPTRATPGDKP